MLNEAEKTPELARQLSHTFSIINAICRVQESWEIVL
jgi:hypothetical protein